LPVNGTTREERKRRGEPIGGGKQNEDHPMSSGNAREPDWSRVERINKPTPPPVVESPAAESSDGSRSMVPAPPPPPNLPAVAAPQTQGSIKLPVEEPRDFIGRLKANSKNRKAMMQALDAHYHSQLEGLRAQLSAGLKVHKSKLDLQAEEYLKSLDAQHLDVLGQLGIRNAATRWKAITELTDLAVAKIKEVQEKQWPESLIDETIGQILELKNRVAAEVMREFGAEKPQE
jgi:hypothetical protein